ncbi:DUF5719 family protein [Salinactinospora qingdaonensis]|uniref:Secreted protein n=1 Tax=Salinactinospora qingdaonensis TaxID=702744 RepID=A0ABP7G119_9ACTN
MRLIVENRFALLLLVVIALAALFGVATVTRPPADATSSGADPVVTSVESAVRVCPPMQGEQRASRLSAMAPGRDEEGGTLLVGPNETDATALDETRSVGQPWGVAVTDIERHTVVKATGAMAAGLEVTQTTIDTQEADRPAMTELRCGEPSLSTWFVAPGGELLDELRVFLANVDDTSATANIDLYATDGPAFSEATRGISVPAHGEEKVDLTGLVGSTDVVAVHVRTNSGRVASSVLTDGPGAAMDWAPPTAAPATRHVIPGVPPGNGPRTLIVAAPGDSAAAISVRVLTPEGEVENETLEGFSVPPAAAASLDLEGPLGKQPGTVVVESQQPILAGVAMRRGDDDPDMAYATAVDPLDGRLNGRATVPAAPEGTTTSLVFGAVGESATVRVTPVSSEGEQGDTEEVTVEPDHTVMPELSVTEGGNGWIVDLAEASGPVYAARQVRRESGEEHATSMQSLRPAPMRLTLPSVWNTLSSTVP